MKEQYSVSHRKTTTKKSAHLTQTILYNKRTSVGITIPDIKLCYRATLMKTFWYYRQVDQWNWIKDLEINSHTYEHVIFDRDVKIIQWKKSSSTNCAGITEYQYVENAKRSISIPMCKTQVQMD